MRLFTVFMFAALALGACGQSQQSAQTEGCARSATHDVSWSDAQTPDVVSVRSDGPSCVQASVTFTVRNAGGDPLWVFASTYYDLAVGGIPPEDAPPVTSAQMDTFLASLADVTEKRSGELPEWREGATSLTDGAGAAYDTPYTREMYEALRARNGAMICYAAAVAATQCLVIDPATNAPAMIVAYGT